MISLESHTDIRWRLAPYRWADADRLSRELGVPFVVATVLASRGLTDIDRAREFLACANSVPDPFLFGHMEAAVDALVAAVVGGGRVVVHGDYDADGITATALMVQGLRDLGLEAEWYLPNRFTEGYGLSRGAVDAIAAAGPGLLVTVDCGVNYPDEVAVARNRGMDVIVVDHHEPGPVLPECHLIHHVAGSYPTPDLCGVGLAFKVLHGLHVRVNGTPACEVPASLHKYLDLVAVGTIADLAPIRGENRYYVKEGLKQIDIGARSGFRALVKVAGCAGNVDSGAVAFRLAPRLNAAGRLADPTPPLDLLLTDDDGVAGSIAQKLHELNGERQEVERRILEDAVAQADALAEMPRILVLSGRDWHEGVVGIVASRLVEKYSRPAILLSIRDGVAKGSGRSISGYDLVSGLTACADWLSVYGGHTMAVGLTMPEDSLEGFRTAIEAHAASILKDADLVPVYRADAILRGEDINSDTAEALASLGPFGSGNPKPRLLLLDAEISQPEVTRTGGHLRCIVGVEGVRARAIGFGLGGHLASLNGNARRCALGVQLRTNEWQGTVRPEFLLESIGGPVAQPEDMSVCDSGCRDCRFEPAEGHAVSEWVAGRAPGDCDDHTLVTAAPEKPKGALSTRDLRDGGGRMAALSQVISTGEPAILFVCSVPHSLPDFVARVPLTQLAGGHIGCLGKACFSFASGDSDGQAVIIAEWDVAMRTPEILQGLAHAVVLDPPYRREHSDLLDRLAESGSRIHLLYGEPERKRTAKLLKYLVHPRFAMVCVYKALLGGATGSGVHAVAADLAWGEGKVILSESDLSRASAVLAELGLDRPVEGAARMEAAIVPLYAHAEAEYEECSRLCQIL